MPKLRKERDKVTGRFLPGHSVGVRHGGYSSISKNIPLTVRRQVRGIREALIRDIAGTEPELTAAQAILIDKTVNLYQITLCLEAYVRREGPFRGKKLDPVLGQNYITYVNTIRLNLRELGITKKAGDVILTPLQIAAEIDAEKEKRTKLAEVKAKAGGNGNGEGQGAEKIASPGTVEREGQAYPGQDPWKGEGE